MYIECVDWLINEMGVVLVLIFEYVEVKQFNYIKQILIIIIIIYIIIYIYSVLMIYDVYKIQYVMYSNIYLIWYLKIILELYVGVLK